MIVLSSTSDKIKLTTDAAVTVDTVASYLDAQGANVTAGREGHLVTTATTTDIVASPASGYSRNVRALFVRNKHATLPVTTTISHYDGTNTYELDKRVLGPGQTVLWTTQLGFNPMPSGGSGLDPWAAKLAGCMNRGDPGLLMRQIQCAGNVAATPTNISTSIARCSLFNLPWDMTVNSIRFYGVGATTGVYRCAIYRYSDLARLTSELSFNTSAATWGTAGSSLALSLTAGVDYFIACSVNATGTTAGIGCAGGTVAASTGQIATAPESLPGSMQISLGYLAGYYFQFAVTSGALPSTAASPAAQAAWTGGMPAFFLDNA